MSRVGKLPITVPKGVTVKVDGGKVAIEGPKGKVQHAIPPSISVAVQDGVVTCTREGDSKEGRALHGLIRRLISNSVTGVSTGSRARRDRRRRLSRRREGKAVQLSLGYSHPIVYQLPPGIDAKVDRQVILTIEGNNKQLLGEVCAQIRALRPPEPYKEKGIVRHRAGPP
jgi:large subunit ribosomal protein L6